MIMLKTKAPDGRQLIDWFNAYVRMQLGRACPAKDQKRKMGSLNYLAHDADLLEDPKLPPGPEREGEDGVGGEGGREASHDE